MLACRFGEHRDNSRNSQSVFLVVYGKIKDEIILKKINRGCCDLIPEDGVLACTIVLLPT